MITAGELNRYTSRVLQMSVRSALVFITCFAVGLLLLAFTVSIDVGARSQRTPQAFDLLVINDDTLGIANTPLAPLLERSDSGGGISFNSADTVEQSPQGVVVEFDMCSACWRGYQAVWSIEQDSLFLTGVQSCCGPKRRHSMDRIKNLLGIDHQDGQAFAQWYSGTLRAPRGSLLQQGSSGFRSVYAREIRLRVDVGHVTQVDTVHNAPYSTPQFPGGSDSLGKHLSSSGKIEAFTSSDSAQYVETRIIVDPTGRPVVDDIRLVDRWGAGSSEPSESRVDAIRSAIRMLPLFTPGVKGGRTHSFSATLHVWRDGTRVVVQLADVLPIDLVDR